MDPQADGGEKDPNDIWLFDDYREFMKTWREKHVGNTPEEIESFKNEFSKKVNSPRLGRWDQLVRTKNPRNIPADLIPRVAEALELLEDDREFFRLLVQRNDAERAVKLAEKKREQEAEKLRSRAEAPSSQRPCPEDANDQSEDQQLWERPLNRALRKEEHAKERLRKVEEDLQALRQLRTVLRLRNSSDFLEKYAGRWYIPVLQALIECAGFRPDPAWIMARTRNRIPLEEIEPALAVLRELMVVSETEGVWRVNKSLLMTDNEVRRPKKTIRTAPTKAGRSVDTVRAYHLKMLSISQEHLPTLTENSTLDLSMSSYHSATMSVDTELLSWLKKELYALHQRMLAKADMIPPDRKSEVVQVSLVCFPLTEPISEATPPSRRR